MVSENNRYFNPQNGVVSRIHETFPQELLAIPQWVVWRYEQRDKNKKPTKVPYNLHTGAKGDSTNPATWGTFEQACAAASKFDGIGFVPTEDDSYVGVDIDGCIVDETLLDEAQRLVDQLDSYTEISPSGAGLRVWLRGVKPDPRCKKTNVFGAGFDVEIYEKARFFTVTGNHLDGTPTVINKRQKALTDLCNELFQQPTKKPSEPRKQPVSANIPQDDQALLDRMFAAANGADVRSLWHGDTTAYGDDASAADLALCNHLAFWTGCDTERMDRMFRESGLMRDKWDRNARSGETYGQGTVSRAISNTGDTYSPGNKATSAEDPSAQETNTMTGVVINYVVTLEDVLTAITAIVDDESMTPSDRKAHIVTDLGADIGNLDRSAHTIVIDALADADGERCGFTKTDAKQFIAGCVADAKKRAKVEKQQRAERARANLLNVRAAKGKTSIDVGNRQLSDIANDALMALQADNTGDPNTFVRGGTLVRINQDERCHYAIQEFGNRSLLSKLAAVADWETVKLDSNGDPQTQAVFPPADAVNAILGAGEWPEFPALGGIITSPIFSRDGVLHDKQGYDRRTKLYHAASVNVGDNTPTPRRIAWAKDLLLNELLGDFAFKDESSKAHAVAYLLLPFVREMIDGATPVHVVDSPSPGTGKGLLLNACAYLALGHDASTMAAARDDEEWRKRLTTSLMRGATHLIIDNVNHTLDSGVLASAFTQPVWEDRTLGSNRDVRIPIRTIWGVTANNIEMSQELTRRAVWIRMDANSEKPWLRSAFKHPNLMQWVRVHRDELVTAAVTLIQAWIEAGQPQFQGRAKGSYESWAGVIGGILQTVGILDFLNNEDELYERVTSKTDMLADFVKAWWEKFGTEATSAYELFKLASFADSDAENQLNEWHNLLGEMLTSTKQRGRQTQLGKILAENQDKVVAGFKVQFAHAANGVKFWMLETAHVEPHVEPVEPLTNMRNEVLHSNDSALPPVDGVKNDRHAEPVELVEPFNDLRAWEIKNFSHVNNNGKKKNNFYIESGGRQKGSTGSTNGQKSLKHRCERHVEPQPRGSTEVLHKSGEVLPGSTETEVQTW